MDYLLCFNCCHLSPVSHSRCEVCRSSNVLYFDTNKIPDDRDYYRMKVMLKVLEHDEKSRALYILDFAIKLKENEHISLFPGISLEVLKNRRKKVQALINLEKMLGE